MKAPLLLILAALCLLTSLGAGAFYFGSVQETERMVASAERRIVEVQAELERLESAPATSDRVKADQDYARLERALVDRQNASQNLVQAKGFRSEAQLALFGATLGPLAVGALLLVLGLRARRARSATAPPYAALA